MQLKRTIFSFGFDGLYINPSQQNGGQIQFSNLVNWQYNYTSLELEAGTYTGIPNAYSVICAISNPQI